MCPQFCSTGTGCASPGAQGCEEGSGHRWIVLIHGAALLNNLQKVLGWFQGHPNISSYAAPRSALLARGDPAACEGKLWWEWRRSIRQQKPPVRLWKLWERAVLDKQK